MRTLIIEDDANKMNALVSFLHSYPHVETSTETSFHSGVHSLLERHFDLVLLDMSMPMYDITAQDTGGRPVPLAGRDILFTMHRKKIQTTVIVVTQYESFEGTSLGQLDDDLRDAFPDIYYGSVYYNTTQDVWKTQLRNILEEKFCLEGDIV